MHLIERQQIFESAGARSSDVLERDDAVRVMVPNQQRNRNSNVCCFVSDYGTGVRDTTSPSESYACRFLYNSGA